MKIRTTDTKKLDEAIAAIAGKAYAHVHTAQQIHDTATRHLAKLKKHLSKKDLLGAVFLLDSQPCLPRAYGSRTVISTTATVQSFPSGLFVTSISRVESWATTNPAPSSHATLTPQATEKLAKRLLSSSLTH